MATVNSRFLAIGTGEPNISTGWQIRVLDYKDMRSLVTVISEYNEFSFTQQLNDPGTGSITLDEDSPFWTAILRNDLSNRTLLDREYVFEAWDNGVPRFAWLGQNITNTLVGDDEARAITISGPGIAQVLTWATILRPGWPTAVPIDYYVTVQATGEKIPVYRAESANDQKPAYNWRFPIKWPTMRMWWTTLKAAQRRGLIPWVTPMFTPTADSGGKKWQIINTIDEVAEKLGYKPDTPSENLLEWLNECTGQDYTKWFGQRLEWLMYPGFKLDVRTTIGTDRSKTVRFFRGNIVSDERTRDRENIFNRVIATDVDGNESNRTDKPSVAAWNLREKRNEDNKNVTDSTLRGELADRYIAQSKDEKEERSLKIPYDDPGRVPYRNFFVGDYVGLNSDYFGSTPDASGGPTPVRIRAITVHVTSDSTVPDCELTLQWAFERQNDVLQQQITQLINKPNKINLGDIANVSIGDPGSNSKLVYNPKKKRWEAVADTSSGGGGSGNRVFIQPTDPATSATNAVQPGDFWLQITS